MPPTKPGTGSPNVRLPPPSPYGLGSTRHQSGSDSSGPSSSMPARWGAEAPDEAVGGGRRRGGSAARSERPASTATPCPHRTGRRRTRCAASARRGRTRRRGPRPVPPPPAARDDLLRLAQPREDLPYGGLALRAALLGPQPVDLAAQPGHQPRPLGGRHRRTVSQVADPAQIVEHELIALDPHQFPNDCVPLAPALPLARLEHDGTAPCASGRGRPARERPANVGWMSTEQNGGSEPHPVRSPTICAPATTRRSPSCCAPARICSRPCPTTSPSSPPAPAPGPPSYGRWNGWTASLCRPPRPRRRPRPVPVRHAARRCSPATRTAWRRPGGRRRRLNCRARWARLRAQALLWGGDDQLRLVRTARELLTPGPSAPSPTGLGPTARRGHRRACRRGGCRRSSPSAGLAGTHDPVSALAALTSLFTDRARMDGAARTRARPSPLAMLDRLRWGPPYGAVQADAPSAPVTWLLDRALLVRSSSAHGRAAPRGRPAPARGPRAPALRAAAARRRPARASSIRRDGRRRGGGPGAQRARHLEDLLTDWEAGSAVGAARGRPGRTGSQAHRHRARRPEPTAAFWIELAYAAGLLASDGEADERYAPTPAYDEWLRRPAHERWAHVVVRLAHRHPRPGPGRRPATPRAVASPPSARAWTARPHRRGAPPRPGAAGRTRRRAGPDPRVRARPAALGAARCAAAAGAAAGPDAGSQRGPGQRRRPPGHARAARRMDAARGRVAGRHRTRRPRLATRASCSLRRRPAYRTGVGGSRRRRAPGPPRSSPRSSPSRSTTSCSRPT